MRDKFVFSLVKFVEKIKMLEVKFYDEVDDRLLKFAVVISKTNGK